MSERKVTLYLMSEKGFHCLKALIEQNFLPIIASVVSARDRGLEKDYFDEIKELAVANGLLFLEKGEISKVTSSYSVAVSWRWLIKEDSSRLIVLHDSILPKYRGFAPLVNSLINGETDIGVTAVFALGLYDAGPIIFQKKKAIKYPIKIQKAIELIAVCYTELILRIFYQISRGVVLNAIPQNDEDATYSLWREEEDYKIDWTQDAFKIQNFVNAVGFPYRGASTMVMGKKARVLDVEPLPDMTIVNRDCGKTLFKDGPHPIVVCGEGLLKINQMIDDETKESLLPLNKFRVRFR